MWVGGSCQRFVGHNDVDDKCGCDAGPIPESIVTTPPTELLQSRLVPPTRQEPRLRSSDLGLWLPSLRLWGSFARTLRATTAVPLLSLRRNTLSKRDDLGSLAPRALRALRPPNAQPALLRVCSRPPANRRRAHRFDDIPSFNHSRASVQCSVNSESARLPPPTILWSLTQLCSFSSTRGCLRGCSGAMQWSTG